MRVSVLFVCLNEEANLRRNAPRITGLLDAASARWEAEVVLEQDGSTDGTAAFMDELARREPRIRVVHDPDRLGKGGGLARAVEVSRGDLLLMTDADMPLTTASYLAVLDALATATHDVVLPSRRHPASRVEGVPWRRRVASRSFNLLAGGILGLGISDTQCGVKGFTRVAFDAMRPRRYMGYTMDLEMLVRARRAGLRILEIPTEYCHGPETGFHLVRDGLRMLRDVWRMRTELAPP